MTTTASPSHWSTPSAQPSWPTDWVPPPPGPATAAPIPPGDSGRRSRSTCRGSRPFDGGSPITNYTVYRGTTPGTATSSTTTGPALGYHGHRVFQRGDLLLPGGRGQRPGNRFVAEVWRRERPRRANPDALTTPTPASTGTGSRLRRATGWGCTGPMATRCSAGRSGRRPGRACPSASLALDQGSRYRWNTNTTNVRALENPAQTQRRATQWVHSTSLRLHLTFNTAYSGVLHLYALDWDGSTRRGIVYVDDGSSVRSEGQLTRRLQTRAPGSRLPITVRRGRRGERSGRSDRR